MLLKNPTEVILHIFVLQKTYLLSKSLVLYSPLRKEIYLMTMLPSFALEEGSSPGLYVPVSALISGRSGRFDINFLSHTVSQKKICKECKQILNVIIKHNLEFMFLTETWLNQDNTSEETGFSVSSENMQLNQV